MARPDCFVAGFYKCGTTSLYMILKQHKNILVSDEKENYFFRNSATYEKGITWYEKHYYDFEKRSNKDIIVEVNPGLSEVSGTASRLSKFYSPDTPIIFILRNPVDWLYSHFRFEIRRGAFPLKDIYFCKKHFFHLHESNTPGKLLPTYFFYIFQVTYPQIYLLYGNSKNFVCAGMYH